MGGVGVGAAQLGGRGGVGGDGDGVDVQLAAAEVRAAREALQEAVGLGLERDPDERAAAEQRDRLADRARADRARVGGRVRVAQQVGGERLVGLDHRDEVGRRAVRVVGERADARDRPAQHGQRTDAPEGVVDAGVGLVETGHPRTVIGAAAARMSVRLGAGFRCAGLDVEGVRDLGLAVQSQATSTWSLRL